MKLLPECRNCLPQQPALIPFAGSFLAVNYQKQKLANNSIFKARGNNNTLPKDLVTYTAQQKQMEVCLR